MAARRATLESTGHAGKNLAGRFSACGRAALVAPHPRKLLRVLHGLRSVLWLGYASQCRRIGSMHTVAGGQPPRGVELELRGVGYPLVFEFVPNLPERPPPGWKVRLHPLESRLPSFYRTTAMPSSVRGPRIPRSLTRSGRRGLRPPPGCMATEPRRPLGPRILQPPVARRSNPPSSGLDPPRRNLAVRSARPDSSRSGHWRAMTVLQVHHGPHDSRVSVV